MVTVCSREGVHYPHTKSILKPVFFLLKQTMPAAPLMPHQHQSSCAFSFAANGAGVEDRLSLPSHPFPPAGRIAAPLLWFVKLPPHTPEDILNGNHKQLRGGKGNAAHQQTTIFLYIITRTEIGITDCRTFEISCIAYSRFENIVLRSYVSSITYLIRLEYQGANKSVESNHYYIDQKYRHEQLTMRTPQ